MSSEPLQLWADGRSALLTVRSSDIQPLKRLDPQLVVITSQRDANVWAKSPLTAFFNQVRDIGREPWAVIWTLIDVHDFVVEDPLRQLIDQGSRLTGFYKGLWEARFKLHENDPKAEDLVQALTAWMQGRELTTSERQLLETLPITRHLESPQELLDSHLFLLTLARQNGLLDRSVFCFDGLQEVFRMPALKQKTVLKELHELVTAFDRWARLGSGASLVLDAKEGLPKLKKAHARLYERVQRSLV